LPANLSQAGAGGNVANLLTVYPLGDSLTTFLSGPYVGGLSAAYSCDLCLLGGCWLGRIADSTTRPYPPFSVDG
jgi:hypothetical protein